MSVVATDLVYYASANMPEDNASPSGGAIDTTCRVVPDSASLFNALADTIDYVSSSAGDTMNVTVTGRDAQGRIVQETKVLNGTTTVNGTVSFQSIEKVVVAAAHAGTVTLKKNTGAATIVALEPGVLTVRRLFYGAAADVAGGASRTFYEKFFVKNNNGTNALLSAQVSETSDPAAVFAFALATAVNDSGSVANRLAAPGGLTFNSTAKNVPGTDLAAGAAIGVWAELTLAAGAAPALYTWGVQVSGQTT
jgi:hypothetical protein